MDGVYYANQASNILKELFKKISDSAQDGFQYVAMLDEVTFNKNGFNFLQLFRGIQIEKVIGLIAVNPAAYECTKEIVMQPPEGKNVKAYQLKTMAADLSLGTETKSVIKLFKYTLRNSKTKDF